MITNPVILDRLLRGPTFRDTPNGDLQTAIQSLKFALENLVDRKKHILADTWMKKVLHAFGQKAKDLISKDKRKEINLDDLLFPAKGKIMDHEQELQSILDKYVLLQADKCRGNHIMVCKNLYIKKCVEALHSAPEHQKVSVTHEELSLRLLQDISGLVHHCHLDFLLQQEFETFQTSTLCRNPIRIPLAGHQLLRRAGQLLQSLRESFPSVWSVS
jgi:hypothetical protein